MPLIEVKHILLRLENIVFLLGVEVTEIFALYRAIHILDQ